MKQQESSRERKEDDGGNLKYTNLVYFAISYPVGLKESAVMYVAWTPERLAKCCRSMAMAHDAEMGREEAERRHRMDSKQVETTHHLLPQEWTKTNRAAAALLTIAYIAQWANITES